MKRILFADNDPHFLRVRAGLLEAAGYEVARAGTLEAAERALHEGRIHVAILDLRLVNDTDEKDTSGLTLAKDKAYRHIPKIVLTKFPTYEAVREALGPAADGMPPAVNFVTKQEGRDVLIQAIEHAFAKYVRVNLDLVIQSGEQSTTALPSLAASVQPETSTDQVPKTIEALQILFRHLFYEYDQIRLDRVLWHRRGRVALVSHAFAEGRPRDSFVVVCGQREVIIRESSSYREFGPKTTGCPATVLAKSSELRGLAANAYVVAGSNLEEARSMVEVYRTGETKTFGIVLNNLFRDTLVDWHQNKTALSPTQSLDDLYRERLDLDPEVIAQRGMQDRLQSIIRQMATVSERIRIDSKELTVAFGSLTHSYTNPVTMLQASYNIRRPLLLAMTPGTLSGDNILADANGRAWLTDFADAGLDPLLWNYVQMESAVRFDWTQSSKLQWIHEMEHCLIEGEFNKFSIGDVEPPLRKPLRAIQAIRRLALESVGNDPMPYHVGVFYHAIKRIAAFNPALHLTATEAARLGHALLAAAMIADMLTENRGSSKALTVETGIRIDKKNQQVSINGRLVRLSRQSYGLLCALWERPNQVFTRQELGVRAFGEKYDASERNPHRASDINRLNTAVFRLRERIEDDPKHPRFLVTEPTGGYRLAVPEDSVPTQRLGRQAQRGLDECSHS